jgi:hypothetical protein
MTVKKSNLTSVYIEGLGSYSLLAASADAVVGEKAWLGAKTTRNTTSTIGYYQWYATTYLLQHLILTTYNMDQKISY